MELAVLELPTDDCFCYLFTCWNAGAKFSSIFCVSKSSHLCTIMFRLRLGKPFSFLRAGKIVLINLLINLFYNQNINALHKT